MNMKNPVVSIVMPTYNVEKYISAAIVSVINQTYSDWELLVIDDGSTDNSNSVAQAYANKDLRIKVLKKENGGLSDARNYGIDLAKGKYIHFFDSDDAVEPDFYEKMVNAIEIKNDDFVICGYYKDFISSDGTKSTWFSHITNVSTPIEKNVKWSETFSDCFNYTWNKLYNANFLKNNELKFKKGLSIIEDQEFLSRVLLVNPSYSFFDYHGYHYIVRQRLTLGNKYSSQFIQSHIQSIILQSGFVDIYLEENDSLIAKANIAISEVKWMLHGIFSMPNNLSFKEKMQQVDTIINSESVQTTLALHKCTHKANQILATLVKLRSKLIICLIYSLRKKLNRHV